MGSERNFGRVRIIKLEPQSREEALSSIHRDDNNRFNPESEGWVVRSWLELTDYPESYMLLMDTGPDGLPDPATEARVPLHKGARFVVDTQRLWHVVVHPGDAPRYALITSFESGAALEQWVDDQARTRYGLSTSLHIKDSAVPMLVTGAPSVAVFDVSLPPAVAFIRSLGRAGVPVIAYASSALPRADSRAMSRPTGHVRRRREPTSSWLSWLASSNGGRSTSSRRRLTG